MLLGKQTSYPKQYDRTILFPVERIEKRRDIKYSNDIFKGEDIWTCYEVSCLDKTGKPKNYIGYLSYNSNSKYIIESKSLKLYLNSFNITRLTANEFEEIVIGDLSNALETNITFWLYQLEDYNKKFPIEDLKSMNIDDIQASEFEYTVNSNLLEFDSSSNMIYCNSNLLRSNCLVTGQPDWGTIEIYIKGEVPTKESLLKYLISFRNHQEFHEQCVERIISTLCDKFNVEQCFVKANYVRRGGIDINPIRCYNIDIPTWYRLVRQ